MEFLTQLVDVLTIISGLMVGLYFGKKSTDAQKRKIEEIKNSKL